MIWYEQITHKQPNANTVVQIQYTDERRREGGDESLRNSANQAVLLAFFSQSAEPFAHDVVVHHY